MIKVYKKGKQIAVKSILDILSYKGTPLKTLLESIIELLSGKYLKISKEQLFFDALGNALKQNENGTYEIDGTADKVVITSNGSWQITKKITT